MSARPPARPVQTKITSLDGDPWLSLVSRPRAALVLARILGVGFAIVILALATVPWQQFSSAKGSVFAYAPEMRRQSIDAPITGRIDEWFVIEGALVEAGQPLVALSDNDPELMDRLRLQLDAHRLRVESLIQRRSALEERLRNVRESRTMSLTAADQRIDMARERMTAAQTDEAAAQARLEAAELNATRQGDLAGQGLASVRTRELADMELRQATAALDRARATRRAADSELRSLRAERERIALDANALIESAGSELRAAEVAEQDARISLTAFESQLARQETQVVVAPRRGRLQTIYHGAGGVQVSMGTALALFVPEQDDRAVELFVNGLDGPLVHPGRHVRLQFEGWPSVQFAGWPGLSVGTFGGVIDFVDPADDGRGRFRVVVIPDPNDYPWPEPHVLRQGVRANGWILLDEVTLGYELWRRINGFPPDLPAEARTQYGTSP